LKAIFGIGNPGTNYRLNRHNVGVAFLDYLSNYFSNEFSPSKGDYYFFEGKIDNSPFVLIKPSTFVNLSGNVVKQVFEHYNLSNEDLLVVYDDVNLEPGSIKVKLNGGDGGHNGVHSIIYHLNDEKFPRIRIGIGKNFKPGEMALYVLSNFSESETETIKPAFELCKDLCIAFITGGEKRMLEVFSQSRIIKNNKPKVEQ
jgi:PTH1 family peptidyl-tRNA hydrolase